MTQDSHFFDAHTHVQFSAYDADREQVLARSLAAGVWMMNVGTQRDTSRAAVELAEKHDGVYAAVGLHPTHTSKSFHDPQELGEDPSNSSGQVIKGFTSRGEVFDIEYYKNLATHPKVLAIGECGLDYYTRGEGIGLRDEEKQKQKDAFLAQIELAKEIQKPLMIHCRDAFGDLIDTLIPHSSSLVPARGVIHFFTGTQDDARALLEMGFSFTFGGVVTFTHDYDEIIKMIPIDRILSETDAPYITPVPYRGKRNEPAYVVEVVKKLAELKGVKVEKMKDQIWTNAKRSFQF